MCVVCSLANPLALKINAETGKPHTIHYSGNCTSPGNSIPRDFFPADPCVQSNFTSNPEIYDRTFFSKIECAVIPVWAKGDADIDGTMEISVINLGGKYRHT